MLYLLLDSIQINFFLSYISGFYENLPDYTDSRQSLVSATPPVYTQSDFACFSSKSYYHKNTIVNPAVIHGE